MKEIQTQFFKALEEIQNFSVNMTLCNENKYKSTEDMLYDITYHAICGVMEMIDGYTNDNLILDIVNRNTRESIREGIELHDTCADYLKWGS